MSTIKGPGGLKLILDEADEATPALVQDNRKYVCTYDFAMGCGYIEEDPQAKALTDEQYDWLKTKQHLVEETFSKARGHWTH